MTEPDQINESNAHEKLQVFQAELTRERKNLGKFEEKSVASTSRRGE